MDARARGINSSRQGLGAWTSGAMPCSPRLQVGASIGDQHCAGTPTSMVRPAQADVENSERSMRQAEPRHGVKARVLDDATGGSRLAGCIGRCGCHVRPAPATM
jgi:hypothetical protein